MFLWQSSYVRIIFWPQVLREGDKCQMLRQVKFESGYDIGSLIILVTCKVVATTSYFWALRDGQPCHRKFLSIKSSLCGSINAKVQYTDTQVISHIATKHCKLLIEQWQLGIMPRMYELLSKTIIKKNNNNKNLVKNKIKSWKIEKVLWRQKLVVISRISEKHPKNKQINRLINK